MPREVPPTDFNNKIKVHMKFPTSHSICRTMNLFIVPFPFQAQYRVKRHIKNKVSKIILYYHSAITCAAPTITDGIHNCAADPTAWNGQCIATCNAGFHMIGSAVMTCDQVNGDGSGDFDATPSCAGIHILIQ